MALPLAPPTTPNFSAQLQRVDTLHQQLKTEQARAQEFLAKLRRGEEIQAQPPQAQTAPINGDHVAPEPVCCCQHHQSKPLTEKEKKLAGEYRKARLAAPNLPALPTHVDEREVRDLEKRVKGLEGRVRGFEGLPPDREMALLEVERLRRELEGLARRREGLFAGLGRAEVKAEERRGGKGKG